jgi:hypothetical protein
MKDKNCKPGYCAVDLTNRLKLVKIQNTGTPLSRGEYDPVLGKMTLKGQVFILNLARLFRNHV